jgi:GTP diphosphokinase / guanosine-3',5'-bis(diphosphate) 3'-diphosphatase
MTQNATYFQDYRAYVNRYRAYDHVDADKIFDELMVGCNYISSEGRELIEQSYILAKKAHAGQTRKSGCPFINHPLTIALMMLPYRPCPITISATLLHDVLEDTTENYNTIAEIHPDIAKLVEGCTKIRTAWRNSKDTP